MHIKNTCTGTFKDASKNTCTDTLKDTIKKLSNLVDNIHSINIQFNRTKRLYLFIKAYFLLHLLIRLFDQHLFVFAKERT